MKKMQAGLALALALSAGVAAADGVLERVAAGGKMVLAYRDSSVPFSYVEGGKPIGYAMDLCQGIVEAVRKKTGVKEVPVSYLAVTSESRMDAITQGRADLECGSTTNNAERRQKVAFTIPHFITGSRLLVRANSPVMKMEDLAGKKLVSTTGSAPLKAARDANSERLMGITIVEAPDHARAVEMVEKGEAEAFAMDEVLLYSLAASRSDPKALKVVGRALSIEALAIMLSKNDAAFKKVVDDEMRRLISSHEINTMYDRWFQQPIPPHKRALNLPPSHLLRDFWKHPTDQLPF